jgi:hypothetical protein
MCQKQRTCLAQFLNASLPACVRCAQRPMQGYTESQWVGEWVGVGAAQFTLCPLKLSVQTQPVSCNKKERKKNTVHAPGPRPAAVQRGRQCRALVNWPPARPPSLELPVQTTPHGIRLLFVFVLRSNACLPACLPLASLPLAAPRAA